MNSAFNLEERLLDFAADAIRLCEGMSKRIGGKHVSDQMIRSATSPMAHHAEAQSAESRKDFIHKMKVAHKELRESSRWLRLPLRVPLIEATAQAHALVRENEELIPIFTASIRTAKSKP